MQEKILKLVKTKYEEEPLEKFILSFMKLNMEHTLIEMLQNELVCEDAYIVLEELGVNENEGQELFEKLLALTSSETHERLAESPLQKHNIYYHMFFLKVLTCESEKEEFLCKFICSEHFPLLVDKLKTPVDTPLVVKLLTSLAETLHSLPKKAKFGLQVNPTTQAQIVLSKLSPVVLENSLVCM